MKSKAEKRRGALERLKANIEDTGTEINMLSSKNRLTYKERAHLEVLNSKLKRMNIEAGKLLHKLATEYPIPTKKVKDDHEPK